MAVASLERPKDGLNRTVAPIRHVRPHFRARQGQPQLSLITEPSAGYPVAPTRPARPVKLHSVDSVEQGLKAFKSDPLQIPPLPQKTQTYVAGMQQLVVKTSFTRPWESTYAKHMFGMVGGPPNLPPSSLAEGVYQRGNMPIVIGTQTDFGQGFESGLANKRLVAQMQSGRRSPSGLSPSALPAAVHNKMKPVAAHKQGRVTAGTRQQIHKGIREVFTQCESHQALKDARDSALSVLSIDSFPSDGSQMVRLMTPLEKLIDDGIRMHEPDMPRCAWLPILQHMTDNEIQRRQPHLAIGAAVAKGVLNAERCPERRAIVTANDCASPSRAPPKRSRTVSESMPSACGGDSSLAAAATVDLEPGQDSLRRSIFCRFVDTGKIRKQRLPRALELCGFQRPNQRDIDQISNSITKIESLTQDNFMRFVREYELRQHEHMLEAFKIADCDHDGSVDREELAALLLSLGVEPMEKVLDSLMEEVDSNCDQKLEFSEFVALMHIMRVREGFTKDEDNIFSDLFCRFDWRHIGTLTTHELSIALSWLGYVVPKADMDRFVHVIEYDKIDGKGSIDYNEFLLCMRKVRERELHLLKKSIAQQDASRSDDSESAHIVELAHFLRSMGYSASVEALQEVVADLATEDKSKTEMNLNHIWDVLQAYRAREGFTLHDSAEVRDAFRRYDVTECGEIGAADVGKAARWYGFPMKLDEQQELVQSVDIDRSGRLDLFEFRKLIRMYWEHELEKMEKAFNEKDPDGSGTISIKEASNAFVQIKYIDSATSTQPPEITLEYQSLPGYINRTDFIRLGTKHRRQMRAHFRDNGGYSMKEVASLERLFQQYDIDGNGNITPDELGLLFQKMFPCMTSCLRRNLDDLMSEIACNSAGVLNFPEFVRMMRQFHDIQAQERASKEQKAIDDTGFTEQEVWDFKEMFSASLTNFSAVLVVSREELTFANIRVMLGSICRITERQSTLLHSIFREATQQYWTSPSPHSTIDFPEFLWLMERLLRTNFANIKTKTGWQERPDGRPDMAAEIGDDAPHVMLRLP